MTMENLLNEINDRLKKIELHLYNDEQTGKDGVIKMQEQLQHRVFMLEEQEKIKKAKAATWGTIGGITVAGLLKIIELIFFK